VTRGEQRDAGEAFGRRLSVMQENKPLYLANTASSVYVAEIELSELMERWYTVAPLVEALRYKPEGRGFDWDFKLT
jgi:hypothetical protein